MAYIVQALWTLNTNNLCNQTEICRLFVCDKDTKEQFSAGDNNC